MTIVDAYCMIVDWNADKAPKGCNLPGALQPAEARLYEKIRGLHCAQKQASHDCAGRLILDRNGITLACPKCGDHRSVYRKRETPDDETLY